jgi:Domain of unknown function (DUF6306)
MQDQPDDEPRDVNSPACAMHTADDAYMGFAGKDEVLAFLDELLEAERAGARVALESGRKAGSGPFADLLQTIEHDEMRWCAMLMRWLKALGAEPSDKVGAFREKAMAIADLDARILFLNRGQGWVVRRLRDMLPRVRDEGLRKDLADMLQAHETNIALANEAVGRARAP